MFLWVWRAASSFASLILSSNNLRWRWGWEESCRPGSRDGPPTSFSLQLGFIGPRGFDSFDFSIVSDDLEDLKQKLTRFELLYQVSNTIHSTLDPQQALDLILREAV